ncbi:hypothetical protein ACJJTC_012123 [Scirpophaga incertulas]
MADLEKAAAPTEPDVINPVRDYLISWGLSQYVDKFEEHSIDLETLQILSAQDIKELIPVIDHRAKLTSQIAMLNNIITDAYSSSTTMIGIIETKERLSSSVSSNESGSPHPGTSSSVQEAELLQDNEEITEKLLWLKNCCDDP